jgi:hypothetical protein
VARIAAFTIEKNEDVFLPIWYRCMCKLVSTEDIYVLDNSSDRFPVNGYKNVWNIDHPLGFAFDHAWLRQTVQDFQRFLLNEYDWVLFSECDEVLRGDLQRIATDLAEGGWLSASVNSMDVVHDPFGEPPLRLDEPILRQRKWVTHRSCMNKPLFARSPLEWSMGFHGFADTDQGLFDPANRCTFVPELELLHLHRVDYGICKDRALARSRWNWAEKDLECDFGRQNRLVGGAFDEWYFEDLERNGVSPLPEYWKGVI